MEPRIHLSLLGTAIGWVAFLCTIPVCAQTNSQARIVRLSFVEGNVTIQRPDVQGWAEAPVNTPLEQGFQLSTGEGSFAEVQFENGGAIRLGEQSRLEFARLEMDSGGRKIDRVELRQGYATFHPLISRLGESLKVGTSLGTLTAQGGTQFRVDLDQNMERVEVISGSVEEQSTLGPMTIEKDSVLVMQPGAAEPLSVSQGITKDDWDGWVADREAHSDSMAAGPSPSGYEDDGDGTPYGWSDLAQNGNWTDVQGEGEGWVPTATVGWTPYSTGEWCWYPGSGYTWIGAEPWGWLPYHFGSWEYVPGVGWVWFPGSLRTWSPGQVTWYQGPGWVGWTPRSHRKNFTTACGNSCGGGAVTTATFRQGGMLTPSRMLRINPTSGTTVNQPGASPTTTAMLPGALVAQPGAPAQGYQGNVVQTQGGYGNTGASRGMSRGSSPNPNSPIIYDPQQGTYVNTYPTQRPVVQPAFPTTPTGPNNVAPTGSSPGWAQPVPVGGGGPSASPTPGQPATQPAFPASRPSPEYRPATPRPAEGMSGTTHVGGGAPPESHASPAPAGGGHSAPSGGGSSGGGHH
jgi:hypothetical protein